MDTDNKTTDVNNITGGEKDTLHNAGVDLSSSDAKEEEFIDIDKAPGLNDPELKKIGLEFSSPKENKEDLSLLKEQMDKKNKMSQVIPPPAKEPKPSLEIKSTSINNLTEVEPTETPFDPTPKEKAMDTNISDLEKEFNQTVGQNFAPTKNESLNDKVSSLQSMLSKIQEKLGFKKTEVKEELENLKKVKEDISKDIKNIKELEESRGKIESQLSKVESIKADITSIEKEVEEELKS